ncbi:UDP-N-acetylmuramate dehydrogenase [Patescibacteria group bacterium]|nr:UDP-N-acetylmuramate dehydrogenase [Patescibacteria group bacterium]
MNDSDLKKKFPAIKHDVSLQEQTSMHLGGLAKWFIDVSEKESMEGILQYVLEHSIPFFILGEGYNTVFSDKGFEGLIIHPTFSDIALIKDDHIYAEAGASLTDIIQFGLSHGLLGMEKLCGIPSSLGGAIFGNAGAYGVDIRSLLVSVEVLYVDHDKESVQKETMPIDELDFGYRSSKMKKQRNYVILAAELHLRQGDTDAARQTVKDILTKRALKHPLDKPSAGCVFKNPKGESAGMLIEKAGLKGLKIGGVQVSEKHANFIVNVGDGTFEDYITLVDQIKKTVKEKFGVNLEEENIIVS